MASHRTAANRRVLDDLTTPPEQDLAPEAHKRQREAWLLENREAIKAYNELVARDGVFSTDVRGF